MKRTILIWAVLAVGCAQQPPPSGLQLRVQYPTEYGIKYAGNKLAVPELIYALNQDHSPDRYWAAKALEQVGPAASDAVPALVRCLHDTDPGLRLAAASALRRIDPTEKAAIPPLVEASGDKRRLVPQVIEAVATCYPNIQERVPVLVELLAEKTPPAVRAASARELWMIGRDAVPILAELLGTTHDSEVRSRIAAVLGRIGTPARAAIPALVDALKDHDSAVRSEAYFALVKIDVTAIPPDAVPATETASWFTDGWPILAGLSGVLVALVTAVVFAFRFRRRPRSVPDMPTATGQFLDIPPGMVVKRLLEVRESAAALIYQSRRRKGLASLQRKIRFPLVLPAQVHSDLDRLLAVKSFGEWNPQKPEEASPTPESPVR